MTEEKEKCYRTVTFQSNHLKNIEVLCTAVSIRLMQPSSMYCTQTYISVQILVYENANELKNNDIHTK